MSSLQVIHDRPGRLRLAVPPIAGSRARASACEEVVRLVPGVRHAQANALTGNLLVLYAPSTETRTAIERCCAAWGSDACHCAPRSGEDGERRGDGGAPPSAARWSGRRGEETEARHGHHRGVSLGAGTVAVELVRHVLPLFLGSCPICR